MYKKYELYYTGSTFSLSRFLEDPMASHISVSKAREFLADLITEVAYKGERVILTRHGKPIGALVSAEDLERLEEMDRPARGARAMPAMLRS